MEYLCLTESKHYTLFGILPNDLESDRIAYTSFSNALIWSAPRIATVLAIIHPLAAHQSQIMLPAYTVGQNRMDVVKQAFVRDAVDRLNIGIPNRDAHADLCLR